MCVDKVWTTFIADTLTCKPSYFLRSALICFSSNSFVKTKVQNKDEYKIIEVFLTINIQPPTLFPNLYRIEQF